MYYDLPRIFNVFYFSNIKNQMLGEAPDERVPTENHRAYIWLKISILQGYREKNIRESVIDTWLLDFPAPNQFRWELQNYYYPSENHKKRSLSFSKMYNYLLSIFKP